MELLASGDLSAPRKAAGSCVVEVESPRGGKLRLELTVFDRRTGRTDSLVCHGLPDAADHTTDTDTGCRGSRPLPQGHRFAGRSLSAAPSSMLIHSRAACFVLSLPPDDFHQKVLVYDRQGSGWQRNAYRRGAFVGGLKAARRHERCVCKCCWRHATRTLKRRASLAQSGLKHFVLRF